MGRKWWLVRTARGRDLLASALEELRQGCFEVWCARFQPGTKESGCRKIQAPLLGNSVRSSWAPP